MPMIWRVNVLKFQRLEKIMALAYFVTETWLSAQGYEAETVELASGGFDVKSFPRQSRSRGYQLLQYANLS